MSVLLTNLTKPEDDETEVLRACRGCLATEVDLHDIYEKGFAQFFGEFTGLAVYPTDGYPQFVCTLCLYLLRKFFKFRLRCHSAMWTLQQIRLHENIIRTGKIKSLDRCNIKHNLNYSEVFTTDILDQHTDEKSQNESISDCDDVIAVENIVKDEEVSDDDSEDDNIPLNKIETVQVEVTIKRENDSSNDGIKEDINNHSSEDNDLKGSIKAEEEEKLLKRVVKRKVETETKRKFVKKKRGRKVTKESEISDDDDDEIGEDWKRIIREIKEENVKNIATKRKVPAKTEILLHLKKAREYSDAYNVDVKFMTKEEQKVELEQERASDEFQKAQYKCDTCCKVLKENTYKTHHILHQTISGDFECEICHYRFKTRARHQEHFYKLHSKKIACKDCGLIIRTWTAAKQHYLWHRGENNNHTCVQCNKHFTHRSNFLRHVQNKHQAVSGPQCLLCDKALVSNNGLKIHMDRTHRHDPRCASCGNTFASTDALATHLNAPDSCRRDISACPKCGKNFADENLMKQHYDADHRKNYYKCEHCNRAFKDSEKYQTHLTFHSYNYSMKQINIGPEFDKDWGPPRRGVFRTRNKGEKKKFVCEICGIEKKYLATLRYHQRVHTGEKPYPCHVCQKTFRQQATLQAHMTTHTDERRYKCPVCEKAFRQIQHRNAHLLTHTKERPYACSACPKRYTGASALKDHVNTAHLGLPPRKWGRKEDTLT